MLMSNHSPKCIDRKITIIIYVVIGSGYNQLNQNICPKSKIKYQKKKKKKPTTTTNYHYLGAMVEHNMCLSLTEKLSMQKWNPNDHPCAMSGLRACLS